MSRSAWALALAAAFFGVVWFATSRRRTTGDEPDTSRDRARTDAEQSAAEIKAAIDRANLECLDALERGDARAYARHFADDSISMPGHGPIVRGRSEIEEAMLDAFRKVQFSDAEWHTIETRYNGKTAFETGAYRFGVKANGKGRLQVMSGRYLVVWRREGTDWKIAIDAAQPGAPAE